VWNSTISSVLVRHAKGDVLIDTGFGPNAETQMSELPDVGGGAKYLDVIGANFYPDNQWYINGSTVPFGHHACRALSDMLIEVKHRYQRPILISETSGVRADIRRHY
jgi:hypothetical protein